MPEPKSDMTESLLKQLEGLATESTRPLEKRLIDTAVWFHRNKDRIDDPLRKIEFLTTTLDIHLELVAMLAQRVQQVEGLKSQSLYLPRGIVDADTGQRFG